MIITRILIAVAALLVTSSSCTPNRNPDTKEDNPYKALELSTKSTEFIQQGQDFSYEFLSRISQEETKDFVISPLSMQFLLGMILDGARGETATQIFQVLGYGQGQAAAVNQYCFEMLRQLPSLDKATKLSIANAIFVDEGWPLLAQYKKDVNDYYDAEIANLNFRDNDGSLRVINGWCANHTNGLIPKILDSVDPSMLAYLLNAVYFKSMWTMPFAKNMTAEETFTNEAGDKSKLKMMKKTGVFDYGENDICQAVRLPYGNGALAMTVLLPKKGHGTAEVIKSLRLTGIPQMYGCDVKLWLPRFETTYHIKLNDILSAMGMPYAFDSANADFLAMSDYALCLSFVQQDAVIKVDEEGTEAAAISSAGMLKNTSVGHDPKPVVFHADHPFVYLITEASTGAVLFAGRYSKS